MAAQVDVPELVNFLEARNVNYEVGLPLKAHQALQAALRKARKWRRPPHWDGYEWQKEHDAIAQASAFEASLRFDGRKDIPLEVFVFQQVLTALRDFPRKEGLS